MPGLNGDMFAFEYRAPVDPAILEGGVLTVKARVDHPDADLDRASGRIGYPIDEGGSIAAIRGAATGRGWPDRLAERWRVVGPGSLRRRHIRPVHIVEARCQAWHLLAQELAR